TVVEGTSRRRSRNDPFGMFERLLDPEVPEEKPVEFTGVRKLSKDICYAGETVIVRYYVIGPADEDFVAERVWNTGKNGIISKEIDEHLPEQTLPEDGTGTIRKHVATLAVTPVMSGNFVLKDEIATVVHEMSTGLFSHRVRRRVRFHAASLDVLPLPEEGRPEDFSGNIGSYRIYLEPPETETVTQYDTVNITVVVAGRGPMDNINPPVYPETDGDTSIFLSDTEKKISIKNASYQGEIRYTYSIIPSETGEQSVGPFSLDFFDPYEGVYRTESTERVHLSVQEAPGEVETQPVSEKENTFPLAIILFGAAAAAVLVVVSVLQYRSETQRREAFRASVIPTGRRKGKRKTSEAVSGGRGKDEPSSATIPADITADDVAGYYRYALKTAASGDDVRGLYRELKRAIDFILKEKPPSQSGREYLEGARTYLERTAYGGAQGDVRILRDIAQKTLTYLEPAP
ncbi:MAG: BatD family protein, partial [Spirochaetota bacterium]